jgi:hypothetical protein
MNIKVKQDENGEYYIDINDLSEMFDDINLISYYTITELDDDKLMIEFFDENDNKISIKPVQ